MNKQENGNGELSASNCIWHADCLDGLLQLDDESFDLIATDPPFNIGLGYDLYHDKRPYDEYVDWCCQWIKECVRILKPDGSMYVCIGDEFAAEMSLLLKSAGLHYRNWLIWYYTFGENQSKKFNRCHTHIHYFTKSEKAFKFRPDAIKVPSARQLKYNDKRAKDGGKLPDDVWQMSRVCGTFKERIIGADGSAHPCQMPESVMERIIMASSDAGDWVLDPFCGTGTTAAVAHRLGRQFITMDVSASYVQIATDRICAIDVAVHS